MNFRQWCFVSMIAVLALAGCVSPELKKEIDEANQKMLTTAAAVTALVKEIELLRADYKAGKLDEKTFGEVKTRLETSLSAASNAATDARREWADVQSRAKEEGANGWSIAGAVIANLALRLLGVPGFASSGGANVATALKGLASKANGGP